MTLRYKMCLLAIKLFEDHGIKVEHAELMSLSIYTILLTSSFKIYYLSLRLLDSLNRFYSPTDGSLVQDLSLKSHLSQLDLII